MVAILRAVRAARTEIERTERMPRYHFSSDEPPIAQGPTITSRTVKDSLEHVILVYARDGRCALLSEMELAFKNLGSAMQPSGAANLTLLAGQLRERARSAFYDERLIRLGRRPLPFMVDAESRLATERYSRTRTDTAATLDVLAEVMRRALFAGLLP